MCVCLLLLTYDLFFRHFSFDRSIAILLLHSLYHAFAKIPIGVHSMFAIAAFNLSYTLMSILLRQIVTTILPFEVVILSLSLHPLLNLLFGMLKFIPVKNERTGQVKRWAIGTLTISPKISKLEHTFHTHTQNRNLASHACITSIRSKSESCCQARYSNSVCILS